MRNTFVLAIAATALSLSAVSAAQSSRADNVRALKQYMSPRTVSELEWELLQFNLLWSGAYRGEVDYVTSLPVQFDRKAARFRASFQLQDKRDSADLTPWSKMARAERASILQGASDQLIELLGKSFPEVKAQPGLVYVEFWSANKVGGRFLAASLEHGKLKLSE